MKICAIFNIAPLYREPIFTLMDQELDIDFLVGDVPSENIAQMNPTKLKGFKGLLRNIYRGKKLVWQRGAIRKALFGRYNAYILTGNTGILSNWVIVLASRLLGRKSYLWTHGLYGDEKGFKLFKNRLFLRLSNGILCYNERGAQITMNHGVASRKVHVIYNSLNYDRQLSLREHVGDNSFARNYFGNSEPYICYVGRLTAIKQLDLLLKAANNGAYNIIIAGDGPERQNLETLTESLTLLDRVWFYGECYDEQMLAQIIANSAAVVSPGNAGLNVIHAMTYGTPIITHNNLDQQMPETEAAVELQTKSNTKLLFKQNDVDNLSQTIKQVINLTQNQRETIKQNAYQIIAEHWNPQKQLQTLKNIGM